MSKGKIAIIVALIGALPVIIGLIIGKPNGCNPPLEFVEYAGRVIDKETQQAIPGVLVSFDTQGAPPTTHTDSNGVYSIKLKSSIDTVHIRVEIEKYKVFDSNLSLLMTERKVEDIRLEPIKSGDINLDLPDDMTLKEAISFAAEKDGNAGVKYIGKCNAKFMQTKVKGGNFTGKDWGKIIEKFQSRLLGEQPTSSYTITKIQDIGVYQIECKN